MRKNKKLTPEEIAYKKGKSDQFKESYKRFNDLYETCVEMKEELDKLVNDSSSTLCVNCGKERTKHSLDGDCIPKSRYGGKKFQEDTKSEPNSQETKSGNSKVNTLFLDSDSSPDTFPEQDAPKDLTNRSNVNILELTEDKKGCGTFLEDPRGKDKVLACGGDYLCDKCKCQEKSVLKKTDENFNKKNVIKENFNKKGCGKMYCAIDGCGEIDDSHSAYCYKHHRSPHSICGERGLCEECQQQDLSERDKIAKKNIELYKNKKISFVELCERASQSKGIQEFVKRARKELGLEQDLDEPKEESK